MTGDPPHPFALSFFAIVASTLWAGVAPGLLSTVVLLAWSVIYSNNHGFSATGTSVRAFVFLVLSISVSRMWDSVKDVTSSETLHRRLIEAAAAGIWVHDEQGVITFANERMANMLGLRVEGLTGRKVEEFLLPEDQAAERVRAANLREGVQTQFDRRLRRPDGSEIWALTCASRLASGRLLGRKTETLALMTEITQRKYAESALRRSESRFRSLFEGVPGGVYQTTRDGRVLSANPVLVIMLGFTTEEELRTVNIASDLFADPQMRQQLSDHLEREGSYRNARYELRRRDGQIFTVLDSACVVRDADGAVLHYAGTLVDITGDAIFQPAALHRKLTDKADHSVVG
jgi:PAS domain S-box-containing protein